MPKVKAGDWAGSSSCLRAVRGGFWAQGGIGIPHHLQPLEIERDDAPSASEVCEYTEHIDLFLPISFLQK